MSWYYEQDGKPVGPVTEEAYQAARTSGLVGPDTRVWKEGWPDWRSAGEAAAAPVYTGGQPPPVPRSAASGMSRCAECSGFFPDLVSLGGVHVCESCKPRALEKLREGTTLGTGPWRDGTIMVMEKSTPLPDTCLKCGAPPVMRVKKTLGWHDPLLYLVILAGPVIYLIIALCLRKTARVFVPLCVDCSGRRKRNLAIGWLAFGAAVAAFIVSGTVLESDDAKMILALSGGALITFSFFWALGTQLVLPRKITDTHAWLKKAGTPVLDRLPQWHGPE